jgi:DNA-binding GntR family transcriptional regulator
MSTRANAIKQKLELRLKQLLATGDLKLPSERILSEEFDTTRVTIRESLRQLEAEGVIYRENRRGWFIAPPRLNYDPRVHTKTSFMDYARQQGFIPRTQVLKVTTEYADDYVAAMMATSPGKPLYRIERMRSLDGRPVLYENILLRADLLKGLDEKDLSGSLHEVIRNDFNVKIERTDLELTVSTLPEKQAEALSAPVGLSALHFQRRYYNEHGAVFEFDSEYWRHDAIAIGFGFKNK